jgi:hypothetical protein
VLGTVLALVAFDLAGAAHVVHVAARLAGDPEFVDEIRGLVPVPVGEDVVVRPGAGAS